MAIAGIITKNNRYQVLNEAGEKISEQLVCAVGEVMAFNHEIIVCSDDDWYVVYDEKFQEISRKLQKYADGSLLGVSGNNFPFDCRRCLIYFGIPNVEYTVYDKEFHKTGRKVTLVNKKPTRGKIADAFEDHCIYELLNEEGKEKSKKSIDVIGEIRANSDSIVICEKGENYVVYDVKSLDKIGEKPVKTIDDLRIFREDFIVCIENEWNVIYDKHFQEIHRELITDVGNLVQDSDDDTLCSFI